MLLSNRIFFEQVEAMLAEGHEVQIRVKGHSMRPLLRNERDTAVLAPCRDTALLHPGDVVLFRCGEQYILHRIVRRDNARFMLAGDGNYRITEQCTEADIAALLVRVIRPSGRIVDCRSLRWQCQSRSWLALPPAARRFVLRVLWHLGVR